MSLTLFYNMYSRGAAIGDVTHETVSTTKIFANGDFGVWTHIVEIESNNLLTAALDNKKKIFFYNMHTHGGALGFLESTTFTTTTVFPEGSFGTWTHIAAIGQLIFFYDKNSGAGAIATTDDTKGIVIIKSYNQGSFGTWTHIVDSGPYLFFYNKNNKAGSIGKLSKEGLNTVKDFGNGSFSTWTHIVGAMPYLLFYNKDNGAGSVGKLSDVGLTAIKDFPNGTFGQWTHLITGVSLIKQTKNKETVPVKPFPELPVDPNLPGLIEPNGAAILAYNSVSGAGALGHLSNDGFKIVHTFESGSFGYWTSISDTSAHIWDVSDLLSSLRHKLIPGETLVIGQELYSQNLKFVLKMQSDGNLVLYRVQDAQALWATGTEGKGATRAAMQKDGNLVLYKASVPIWASNTEKNAGALLKLQNDGNLVIYKGSAPIWDTGVAAAHLIKKTYMRTGGSLGPLGAPVGGLVQSGVNSTQNFQLGSITLNNESGDIGGYTYYDVEVKLSAVKCFGTEDPGGTDETFLVISLISINPNFDGNDKLVYTMRTEIDNNVQSGKVFFKQRTIGKMKAFPGSGIKIYVAIFDHENGDADDLRDKINAVLEDAANKAAQLIAGAAAAGDQKLAGPIGDITEYEIGGVKPVKIITLTLADLFAKMLSDDMIGENEFIIPAQNILDIVKKPSFEASFRRHPDVLGSDVQFNWPRTDAEEFLFSGGGGSYKVYLTITPIESRRPLEPRIPIP